MSLKDFRLQTLVIHTCACNLNFPGYISTEGKDGGRSQFPVSSLWVPEVATTRLSSYGPLSSYPVGLLSNSQADVVCIPRQLLIPAMNYTSPVPLWSDGTNYLSALICLILKLLEVCTASFRTRGRKDSGLQWLILSPVSLLVLFCLGTCLSWQIAWYQTHRWLQATFWLQSVLGSLDMFLHSYAYVQASAIRPLSHSQALDNDGTMITPALHPQYPQLLSELEFGSFFLTVCSSPPRLDIYLL